MPGSIGYVVAMQNRDGQEYPGFIYQINKVTLIITFHKTVKLKLCYIQVVKYCAVFRARGGALVLEVFIHCSTYL